MYATLNFRKLFPIRAIYDNYSDLKNKTNISISKLEKGITFEKNAEKYLSKITPIECGMGKKVSTILDENNVVPSALIVDAQNKIEKPVIINFDCKDKACSLSSQIITAQKNSEITVIMNFTSNKKAEGLQIVQTKLYAEQNAKIHLVTVNLLGKNYIHLNDSQSCGRCECRGNSYRVSGYHGNNKQCQI